MFAAYVYDYSRDDLAFITSTCANLVGSCMFSLYFRIAVVGSAYDQMQNDNNRRADALKRGQSSSRRKLPCARNLGLATKNSAHCDSTVVQ